MVMATSKKSPSAPNGEFSVETPGRRWLPRLICPILKGGQKEGLGSSRGEEGRSAEVRVVKGGRYCRTGERPFTHVQSKKEEKGTGPEPVVQKKGNRSPCGGCAGGRLSVSERGEEGITVRPSPMTKRKRGKGTPPRPSLEEKRSIFARGRKGG